MVAGLGISLFLTIPLAGAQVTQEWIAAYNGPSGSIDSVRNLAVDDLGNVYVAGSTTSSTLLDYTTLKYNSAGQLLWEARYDGPAHFRDDARWLAIDGAGNVYVTGSSRTGVQAGTEDFLTVKYNTNGVQQWTARYNGPSSGPDIAAKVAVDESGSVFVTGSSAGIGTLTDFTTIKYNSSGVQEWVARYNGPGNSIDAPAALAVDGLGRTHVTGWSRSTALYGSEDYLTIRYSSSGVEEWTARYNGPSNMIDQAKSIALDNSGIIYVTGYSLSPSTQADYVTIKYNSNGAQQWLASHNNSLFNGSDIARMVIVDQSANVYVTGTSNTAYPLGYPNYVTIKYDASGAQQWISAYNGPGNAADEPSALALDELGNVYVTGKATMPGFVYDFATVKYNSGGAQVWEERFGGSNGLQDEATWIQVDGSGNVYVAGNSMYYTNFASDFVVIKYSQSDPGGGEPPVVADIPDQSVPLGGRFAPVRLDNFVSDPDNDDNEISWIFTGNASLVLQYDAVRRVLKIRSPRNWTGSETVAFTATDPDGNSDTDSAAFTVTALVPGDASRTLPEATLLLENYPNPFNPSTTFEFRLAEQTFVELRIFDLLGREVATLVNELRESGTHRVNWNASGLSSGVYIYRLMAGDFIRTGRLALTK